MKPRFNKAFWAALCVSALFHAVFFLFVSGISGKTEKQPSPQKTFSLINISLIPENKPVPVRPPVPPPEQRNSEDGTVQETADETLAASFEVPAGEEDSEERENMETAVYAPAAREAFLSRYAGTIRELIDRRKEYPYQARRQEQEGIVEVRFVVSRSGRLSGEPVLEKKCRYPRLNAAALEAVRNAQPYPAFPPEIPDAEIPFLIAVTFSLK
jgi:protein TonB